MKKIGRIDLASELGGPQSLNAEARTVSARFYSGHEVDRIGEDGEPYTLQLSLKSSAVDLAAFDGAPIRDTHVPGFSVRETFGAIVAGSTSAEKSGLVGTLQFSERSEVEPIWRDVQQGLINRVSMGLRVDEAELLGYSDSDAPRYLATSWTPIELSLVDVPADPGAVMLRKENPMEKKTTSPELTEEQLEAKRLAAVQLAEDTRVADIKQAFSRQDEADTEKYIALGLNVAETAERWLNDEAARSDADEQKGLSPARTRPRLSRRDRIDFMTEAICARVGHGGDKISEGARQYMHAPTWVLARECLAASGLSGSEIPQAPSQIIDLALGEGSHAFSPHISADFPDLLSNVASRSLLRAFEASASGIKRLSKQTFVRDFKMLYRLRLGGFAALPVLAEGSEISRTTAEESLEGYKLGTYSHIFQISRQAIVNDDLNSFVSLAANFGVAAASTESDIFAALLNDNSGLGKDMADGNPVCDALHFNLVTSGGAPSVAALSENRKLHRAQVGLDGVTLINSTPTAIIVPPALETVAEQLLADVAANTVDEGNPFSRRLDLVVEPRLTSDVIWYSISNQVDCFEHAYLDGQSGPMVDSKPGFSFDDQGVRVRLDFGATVVDHRGIVCNDGVT